MSSHNYSHSYGEHDNNAQLFTHAASAMKSKWQKSISSTVLAARPPTPPCPPAPLPPRRSPHRHPDILYA